VMMCSTPLCDTHCLVTYDPDGCIIMHGNLSIESYLWLLSFGIYFHPYYDYDF
jgi:hypothetical protein